jgi:hypothetical protein
MNETAVILRRLNRRLKELEEKTQFVFHKMPVIIGGFEKLEALIELLMLINDKQGLMLELQQKQLEIMQKGSDLSDKVFEQIGDDFLKNSAILFHNIVNDEELTQHKSDEQ